MRIFLIGESGAAVTPTEEIAQALIEIAGYQRCTEAEYWQKLRAVDAVDKSDDV